MSLFLIFAVPLWLILIISFYPKPARGWRGILLPFLGGLVLGMGTLSVTLSVLTRTPFSTDMGPLYRWAWYRGPGWGLLLPSVVLAFLYRRNPTSFSRIRELACWIGGAAFTYTVYYALSPDPGFDSYRVLVAPFVWIGCIGSVIWLLDRGLRIDGWLSWVLLAAAAMVSSALTWIPVLYAVGSVIVTVPLAVLVSAGATFLVYLDSRGLFS